MILHTLLSTTILLSPKHIEATTTAMAFAILIALFTFAMVFDELNTTKKRITYWVIVAVFIIFLIPILSAFIPI